MHKKISVIVPIYNGERYIERCVDSILNQRGIALEDLELLLLNDGSKDGSLKIIKSYEAKNPGVVRALTHKNMGVAKTRNKGIEIARAEYVMFIDQDDWIDHDYCAVFYKTIKSHNLDVAIGGYRRPNNDGEIVREFIPKDTAYGKYTLSAAWAKIHRTEFLKENNISFFDNKFGEDLSFTTHEYISTSRYARIDYVGYNWFYNETSVSNTAQKEMKAGDRKSILSLLEKLLEIKAFSYNENEQKLYEYYVLRTAIYYLLYSIRKTKKSYFIVVYEEIFVLLSRDMPEMIRRRWIFTPSGEIITARLAVCMFMILHKTKTVKIFAAICCQ